MQEYTSCIQHIYNIIHIGFGDIRLYIFSKCENVNDDRGNVL